MDEATAVLIDSLHCCQKWCISPSIYLARKTKDTGSFWLKMSVAIHILLAEILRICSFVRLAKPHEDVLTIVPRGVSIISAPHLSDCNFVLQYN